MRANRTTVVVFAVPVAVFIVLLALVARSGSSRR